ncbi:LLM class flavin-dependent oxidoreductase [Corynebacterium timonense]|uniref:Flavin-dependent oxidoreductase, luciferase family (Includes alkanesulfonate monooxygenase SsuD and methylene tetrahydromethanopterin reductase) n=1 Tax=Corynebacterium timonense TaxID=441500 RepID=A0A1H1M2L5_9CORY|nr:LLM class flavin-dependent oxidoreductase [Corynebacterium timonense]SDR81128.1 Flavin-dependent oxidoreductase, luciferase family (includes alkanesulfonate monooxygenase SsuD and methylene tetrahydromethanopterin reductase) [Corynebacterium timonense]
MTEDTTRRVHLAAHFPGVNNTTVWAHPDSGSHIEFDSFRRFAQTAERGLFDFFFLAEGLRLREDKGQVDVLDVAGRPNTLTALAALAAVTRRIGLVGTLSTTFNEPYELARQIASVDVLSGGRAAWNAVTTPDSFTGANFRRGGFLDYADRYHRAVDFIASARELWDAGPHGEVRHSTDFFTFSSPGGIPTPVQGHPVVFQAGNSPAGRDFAAGSADVIFTLNNGLEDGQKFYADVHERLRRFGRSDDSLKIYPGISFFIGDTPEQAQEHRLDIEYQQVSGAGAIAFVERVWNRDLSSYDPDGPLPEVDPVVEDPNKPASQGREVRYNQDAPATVAKWRALAEAENLSIRDLVVRVSRRAALVGTPAQIAEDLIHRVQNFAADGYILVPPITPGGLDEFVDRVVPELQERGAYPERYEGTTLRDHLGLPAARPAADWAAARANA